MSKIRYKYCIVPYCKSTTIKTPEKKFFSVPVDEERRKEWCLAVGRVPGKHKTLSVKCSRFVCEDHFDVEKDMDNYMMWKMVGVGKLLLKKGVLPHKLECQREKLDVKKSDTVPNVLVQRANSQTHRTLEISEIKNRNKKLLGSGLCNIEKESSEANHRVNIRIQTEVIENMCVSEQNLNRVELRIKNEVNDIENYTFKVRYDSDTGGEYLIHHNCS